MDIRFEIPSQFHLRAIPCRVELKPGQKVGDYVVDKVLGAGTYGIVYQVNKNGQPYALKLLKLWEIPKKEDKEVIGERFLREFHAAQTISDYLIHSFDFGFIENNPIFIMDYVHNGDLRSRVGKLTTNEIQKIGTDTLKGLRDLHNSGIIHRDIKPENVMLDASGKALLSDFGIAAFVNHHMGRFTKPDIFGRVRNLFGTYAYIAPEQLRDTEKFKSTTPRTDIWSWGVMMFELFGDGKYPWGALETDSDLADFIRNAKNGYIVNREVFNKMPLEWADIIIKCLQPKFEKRIEKVDSILHQLDSDYKATLVNSISAIEPLKLTILQGVEPGRMYILRPGNKRIFTIGRSENNDCVIEDFMTNYISRQHATIECVSSLKGWYIRDGQWNSKTKVWQRSTNGTYLNSADVGQNGCRLSDGDIITIGDTTMKVTRYNDVEFSNRKI